MTTTGESDGEPAVVHEREEPTPGRLGAVASLVPEGSRVADIGSGHGILARLLVAGGRAQHCIATERTPELSRLIRTFPNAHALAERLERRHGYGLRPIRPEDGVEVFVLAGLGARTIRCILEDGWTERLAPQRLVLQPQTEAGLLRRWAVSRGFAITAEAPALERRQMYVVLRAEHGPAPEPAAHPLLSRDDLLEVGPCLARSAHPLVLRWWRDERARLQAILVGAAGAGRRRAEARLALAERVLRAVAQPRVDPVGRGME